MGGMEAVLVRKSSCRMRFQKHGAEAILIAGAFLDLALGGNGKVPLARSVRHGIDRSGGFHRRALSARPLFLFFFDKIMASAGQPARPHDTVAPSPPAA